MLPLSIGPRQCGQFCSMEKAFNAERAKAAKSAEDLRQKSVKEWMDTNKRMGEDGEHGKKKSHACAVTELCGFLREFS
jgi:hypothetical protein